MSDNSTPQGTDLYSAQNAIKSMLTPQQDNVATDDALEANATQVEDAEMPDDQEEEYEAQADNSAVEGSESDLDDDDDDDGDEYGTLDLSTTIEVGGEEKTIEELRSGFLRQKDYTRKTQELAEHRKAVEAKDQEMDRERAEYAQLLPAMAERINQAAEQEPDWDTLYDADPVMAAKAERQWRKQQEGRVAQLQAVQAEQQRMHQIAQTKQQQMQQSYLEQQRHVLPDIIPEWRDNKVAATEATQIRDFLINEGFTEQDVSGMSNATLVKLARKAMLYDRGETRANEVKAKPKKPRTKTLKSGSRASQPKRVSAAQEAQNRARKTGRVNDAAAAIKAILL
tara:strand:+ start:2370 stop:3389 length:1020 start_codon:yes stop_codon:yes gene_type:complete